MSKLNIDQKSVRALFSEKKADFLIPDYQRPYAWGEKECQTLWDDLFLFAFPDNDCDKFNSDSDEYFLGPIVTFKNDDGKMEIIDGQQRLTTLMLLLRAFYEKYGSMKNDKAVKTSKFIEQCIWKTDEFGDPDKSALKIDSEVATDKEKDEFLNILKTGTLSDCEKSSYANNYRFFQQKIVDFLNTYPDWFSFFPIRIMNKSRRNFTSITLPKASGKSLSKSGRTSRYCVILFSILLPALRWMSFSHGICTMNVQSNASNPRQRRRCANSMSGMQISGMMCRIKMLSASLTEFFAGSLF